MNYQEYDFVDEELEQMAEELKSNSAEIDRLQQVAEGLKKRNRAIEGQISKRVYRGSHRVLVRVRTDNLRKSRSDIHNTGCPRVLMEDAHEELLLIISNRMVPTYGAFPDAREDWYRCPECAVEFNLVKI